MSAQKSYCPQCHNDVVFVVQGNLARCPICGLTYLTEAGAATPPKPPSPVLELGKILLKVFLILVGLVVVGVAVLFAGCVIIASGGRF